MTIDELLGHFESVVPNGSGRWKALCPAHHDHDRSLAIALGENGRAVLDCHGGCKTEDVLTAANLEFTNLFDLGTHKPRTRRVSHTAAQIQLHNEVYSTLLIFCPLSKEHSDNLIGRGLKVLYSYGTLSVVGAAKAIKQLLTKMPAETLYKVPGFVQNPASGLPKLVREDGLLIPVRNLDGLIVAMQVRTDDEDGKYKWLSHDEASSGTPIHIPYLPVGGVSDPTTVRVTEGPLKADVVQFLDPQLRTVAIPGINATGGLSETLKVLAPSKVVLALDADWTEKPQVRLALHKLYKELTEAGYEVGVDLWPLEDGKGLDDFLHGAAEGEVPTRVWSKVAEEELRPTLEEEFEDVADKIVLRPMSYYHEEQIEWTWKGWLVKNALNLLDGNPKEGKSLLTCAIMAQVLGVKPLPGDELPKQSSKVILLAHEDGKANTWTPRMIAAGITNFDEIIEWDGWDEKYDQKKRRFLPELPKDIRGLEYAIRKNKAGLVVIDPLFTYLGGKYDTNSDSDMKHVLIILQRLAEETGTCIIGLRHLNKNSQQDNMYRGMGSNGIFGVARSGLLMLRDKEDDDVRLLGHTGTNVGKNHQPWQFRVVPTAEGRIRLDSAGPYLGDRFSPKSDKGRVRKIPPAMLRVMQFIMNKLEPVEYIPASDMRVALERAGHSKGTVDRTIQEMDLVVTMLGRPGHGGHWIWQAPGRKPYGEPAAGEGGSGGEGSTGQVRPDSGSGSSEGAPVGGGGGDVLGGLESTVSGARVGGRGKGKGRKQRVSADS